MVTAKSKRSIYFLIALVSLILITDTAVVRLTAPFAEDPILVYAILFDFMLVIPFLYWVFVLRVQGKSIAKVAPWPIAGAIAAWVALPVSMRGMVWQSVWPVEAVIIALEVAILGYELRAVYRLVRRFRLVSKQEPDTGEALRIAMYEGVGKGKFAHFLLHDLSMLYHLFFSWGRKRKSDNEDSMTSFTYHRKTSQTLYAAIITKIIVLEGVAMHLLLQQWSHWAAWIMTAADLWLLSLIWADSRASFLQPVRLAAGHLKLRYGLRIQADIPLTAIANVACSTEYSPDRNEQRDSAMPMLSAPNVRIELAHPMQIQGFLFQPRTVKFIYLALDEPKAFVQRLEDR
ncbi:hypothetical protein [Cohnella terricola]|uniref:Uncharacterized protein n=1 Tax=Cohnella terricola TaxID=1289167 RepID=A0A559JA11_9BACL|nr:hypothetical protein [Cohnella terricola]TVX96687.1 hypothetical protein FPZ45_20615 [Cohnella terricola]